MFRAIYVVQDETVFKGPGVKHAWGQKHATISGEDESQERTYGAAACMIDTTVKSNYVKLHERSLHDIHTQFRRQKRKLAMTWETVTAYKRILTLSMAIQFKMCNLMSSFAKRHDWSFWIKPFRTNFRDQARAFQSRGHQ